MAKIGFIGIGNMGFPMAQNLIGAGHVVKAFDVSGQALSRVVSAGAEQASDVADAARDVETVVTMLPAGPHVRGVYAEADGVLPAAAEGTLLIDASTIDVATSRAMHAVAAEQGFDMLDAPVSGGVVGAEAGTLTFMCGGSNAAFERARPILEGMGKNVFHAGGPGDGQGVKICNNMILGSTMIAVGEAMNLADGLGLDRQKLWDILNTATARCWALSDYCPAPGPVPAAPSNNGFRPGFTGGMMLKDMRLSQDASIDTGVPTPMAAAAAALYSIYCNGGGAEDDFSGIIRLLSGELNGNKKD